VAFGYGTVPFVNQVAHGFTSGQAVYYTGSAWALAKADAAATLAIGVVSYVDVNNFYVYQSGILTGLTGLTAGQYYFVSTTSAGTLTTTEPIANLTYSNPILFALTTTTAIVCPYRPSQINTAIAYTPLLDFLLDNEPMSVSTTYTATWVGGIVSKEQWFIAGPIQLKSIDYTFSNSKVTTEVRKVFAGDGITVIAQSTIAYTYVSDIIQSTIVTRNI
jgi:hypothetical protein